MNPWLATLQWYVDQGVDEAIADTPWDRFATPTAAAPANVAKAPVVPQSTQSPAGQTPTGQAPAAQPSTAPPSLGPGPPPRAPMPAAQPAPIPADLAAAEDLAALRTLLDQYEGCALKATATNTVFGAGPANANLMIIGEAPGEEEDRQGEPFVGASGQLLDRMLAAIGLERAGVYITNTIYWRPPGNRTPTPAEIQACLPFLRRQIALIQPQILLLVGGAAAKTMLQRTEGIMRLRGRWFEYETGEDAPSIPAMATFHPAYLLRSPAQKREAWRDLQALQNRLIDSNS